MGFWMYGLFDLDEGFYAAVVAEMNRAHEWITPLYGGAPWYEKPILLYWLAKPSVLIFGQAVGPRLPDVLANALLYILCGWFLAKNVSARAGKTAMLLLGSSLLLAGLGRMMMTDALLNLCLAAALIFFYISLTGKPSMRLWTAFFLGLAVLAKGPVGLALFVFVALFTYINEPDLRPAFRGYWALGTVVLVAVICSWYLPAYLKDGRQFVQDFLIEQNINRFRGGDKAHPVPMFLGLPLNLLILLVGAMPWSFFSVSALPKDDDPDLRLKRYFVRWAVVVIVFFGISSSWLPHYVLPALTPLCLLVAVYLARRPGSFTTIGLPVLWSVAVCGIANGAFILYYRVGQEELHYDANQIVNRFGDVPTTVIAYEMPRRQNDRGTLKPKLQETSQPSLRFYLDSPNIEVLEMDGVARVIDSAKARRNRRVLLLTRTGRISRADEDQAMRLGYSFNEFDFAVSDADKAERNARSPNYAVYGVDPL